MADAGPVAVPGKDDAVTRAVARLNGAARAQATAIDAAHSRPHRIGHGTRLDGGRGGVSSLVRIKADTEAVVIRKKGRFSCELGILESPVHQNALIRAMCVAFVTNIQKSHGYEYADGIKWPTGARGLIVSEPLEHVEFESTPIGWNDLGLYEMPKPPGPGFSEDVYRNYRDLCLQYEEAERRKAAKTLGEGPTAESVVDFVVAGHFINRVSPGYRLHLPYQHDARAQMNGVVPAAPPSGGLVTATR